MLNGRGADMARNPSHRTYERRYKAGLPKPAAAPAKHATLYDACVAAGLAIDSHESDMYLLDTPKAVALIVTYRGVRHGAKRFRSAVDGNLWWDVPFAFAPFWRSRCKA